MRLIASSAAIRNALPSQHYGGTGCCAERGQRARVADLREVLSSAGARACGAPRRQARARTALTKHCLRARKAVHQIAGLRGLFPDDAFKRREIAGLPNVMELKARHILAPRLQPRVAQLASCKQADFSAEARQVCEWIDRGAA